MGDDELGERLAARENDRHGNAPLRRGPDPDKVAAHLATGEGEKLIAAKARDNFTTESPIRAFTEFRVSGTVAIGKGFRPSLAHLHTYLDAMEAKEGWTFLQILLPDNDAGDPTIVFRRKVVSEARLFIDNRPGGGPVSSINGVPVGDPINPKHYAGRACADIGERLSANAYQVLKYVWRLGKKDDPCVEMGKAVWYAESEFALIAEMNGARDGHRVMPNVFGLVGDPWAFLEERIADQSEFTRNIARTLWSGYNGRRMRSIIEVLDEHRFHLGCKA